MSQEQYYDVRIQHKIDTTSNWSNSSLILKNGELGFEKTNNGHIRMKVGDGHHAWKDLDYADVGTPLAANSLEEMTNPDKIYVYTGADDNINNLVKGNWYYYNGSNWAEGGVYNAEAIETDYSLTIENMAADAKAVGELFEVIKNSSEPLSISKWAKGGVSKNGGNMTKPPSPSSPSNYYKQIRSDGYQQISNISHFHISPFNDTKYKMALYLFENDNFNSFICALNDSWYFDDIWIDKELIGKQVNRYTNFWVQGDLGENGEDLDNTSENHFQRLRFKEEKSIKGISQIVVPEGYFAKLCFKLKDSSIRFSDWFQNYNLNDVEYLNDISTYRLILAKGIDENNFENITPSSITENDFVQMPEILNRDIYYKIAITEDSSSPNDIFDDNTSNDEIQELGNNIIKIYTYTDASLTKIAKYADAKIVGDKFKDTIKRITFNKNLIVRNDNEYWLEDLEPNTICSIVSINGIQDAPKEVNLGSYYGWVSTIGAEYKIQLLFCSHNNALFYRFRRNTSNGYTWTDWFKIEQPAKPTLNLLFIGNSATQDAVAYLPPILNELLPEYDITYGNLYEGSVTLQDHVDMYNATPIDENGDYFVPPTDPNDDFYEGDMANYYKYWAPNVAGQDLSIPETKRHLKSKYHFLNMWRPTYDHWHRQSGWSFYEQDGELIPGLKSRTLTEMLEKDKWDFIFTHGASRDFAPSGTDKKVHIRGVDQFINSAKEFLKILQNHTQKPFTPIWIEWKGRTLNEEFPSNSFEKIHELTIEVMQKAGFADYIPIGSAFEYAEKELELTNIGLENYENFLSPDHKHMNAGIPVLLAAYTIALKILKLCGKDNYIVNKLPSWLPTDGNNIKISAETEYGTGMTHGFSGNEKVKINTVIPSSDDSNVNDLEELDEEEQDTSPTIVPIICNATGGIEIEKYEIVEHYFAHLDAANNQILFNSNQENCLNLSQNNIAINPNNPSQLIVINNSTDYYLGPKNSETNTGELTFNGNTVLINNENIPNGNLFSHNSNQFFIIDDFTNDEHYIKIINPNPTNIYPSKPDFDNKKIFFADNVFYFVIDSFGYIKIVKLKAEITEQSKQNICKIQDAATQANYNTIDNAISTINDINNLKATLKNRLVANKIFNYEQNTINPNNGQNDWEQGTIVANNGENNSNNFIISRIRTKKPESIKNICYFSIPSNYKAMLYIYNSENCTDYLGTYNPKLKIIKKVNGAWNSDINSENSYDNVWFTGNLYLSDEINKNYYYRLVIGNKNLDQPFEVYSDSQIITNQEFEKINNNILIYTYYQEEKEQDLVDNIILNNYIDLKWTPNRIINQNTGEIQVASNTVDRPIYVTENYIPIPPNSKLYVSAIINDPCTMRVACYDQDKNVIDINSSIESVVNAYGSTTNLTIDDDTALDDSDVSYLRIQFRVATDDTPVNYEEDIINLNNWVHVWIENVEGKIVNVKDLNKKLTNALPLPDQTLFQTALNGGDNTTSNIINPYLISLQDNTTIHNIDIVINNENDYIGKSLIVCGKNLFNITDYMDQMDSGIYTSGDHYNPNEDVGRFESQGVIFRFQPKQNRVRVTSKSIEINGENKLIPAIVSTRSSNNYFDAKYRFVEISPNIFESYYHNFKFKFHENTPVTISANIVDWNTREPIDLTMGNGIVFQVRDLTNKTTYSTRHGGLSLIAQANVEYVIYFTVTQGWVGDILIRPQLEIGTIQTPYEPFKGCILNLEENDGNKFNLTASKAINKYQNFLTTINHYDNNIYIKAKNPIFEDINEETGETVKKEQILLNIKSISNINNTNNTIDCLYSFIGTGSYVYIGGIPKTDNNGIVGQIHDGVAATARDTGNGAWFYAKKDREYVYRIFITTNTSYDGIITPIIVSGRSALPYIYTLDATTAYAYHTTIIIPSNDSPKSDYRYQITCTQLNAQKTTIQNKSYSTQIEESTVATRQLNKIINNILLSNENNWKPMISFIDDDTESLALVNEYHDILESENALGGYAVVTNQLLSNNHTGLKEALLNYEQEGFSCFYHCPTQRSNSGHAGNTTYYWVEDTGVKDNKKDYCYIQPNNWSSQSTPYSEPIIFQYTSQWSTNAIADKQAEINAYMAEHHPKVLKKEETKTENGITTTTVKIYTIIANDEYNETRIRQDFIQGLQEMQTFGFLNWKYWITPYGVNNQFMRNLAKQYGFKCLASYAKHNMKSYVKRNGNVSKWNIPRTSYSFIEDPKVDPPNNGNTLLSENNPIPNTALKINNNYTNPDLSAFPYTIRDLTIKNIIDACINDKGWLIITTHLNEWPDDATERTKMINELRALIRYCKQAGAEIVPFQVGFETFKPYMDMHDMLY